MELLNVIHLLSDSVELVSTSYTKAVRHYFQPFSHHPAVAKARELALINCDFPLHHAWCFYDFPSIKLHAPDTLGAYNQWATTAAEMERLKGYYALAPAIISILEANYIKYPDFTNFQEFFPVLLKQLANRFPSKS